MSNLPATRRCIRSAPVRFAVCCQLSLHAFSVGIDSLKEQALNADANPARWG